MSDHRPRRRLAAIVAADVAGYSRLIGLDEEGTLKALRTVRREIVDPLLHEHGGRVANTAGDSLLLEFPSVVDAARCALAMQKALADRNADIPGDRRLAFRIGIHVGDVVSDGDDLLGDCVNVAARLEGLADANGIALSDDAYRQIRDRVDEVWSDTGEHALKNIAHSVRVWRWEAQRPGQPPKPRRPAVAASLPHPKQADTPSIAVLPFDNMSGDPEQGYFADGITEDLITEISRIPGVLVIARNSTFTYKGKAASIQDVCCDLGVRYVLEGSVRKAGNRVRISTQLIDWQSGGHLWAERYDRSLEDIFAVQDDVTDKIVRALEVQIVGRAVAGHAHHEPTRDPEAYDCVLRGREQYRLFSKDGNASARELYRRAIALDPDYAEPYAGLAETYVQDWLMGSEPTLDRAFELAQEATTRDPTLPLVQEAMSTVHLFKRQHTEAVATAQRWIELEPGNAEAYATLAGAIHYSGENQDVITLIETAMRLNPFYPFYYAHYIGLANFAMRRFDEAVMALKRAVVRSPDALWPHVYLAACHGHLGDGSEASAQAEEVRRIRPDFSSALLQDLAPYKNSADVDLVITGLRKAGLPT